MLQVISMHLNQGFQLKVQDGLAVDVREGLLTK